MKQGFLWLLAPVLLTGCSFLNKDAALEPMLQFTAETGHVVGHAKHCGIIVQDKFIEQSFRKFAADQGGSELFQQRAADSFQNGITQSLQMYTLPCTASEKMKVISELQEKQQEAAAIKAKI